MEQTDREPLEFFNRSGPRPFRVPARLGQGTPARLAVALVVGAAVVGCRSSPQRLSGHAAQSFTGPGAELNQKAAAAIDQGDFEEAESLYRQVVTLSREQLGTEHADVAKSLANLAWVRQQQGQFGEAERLNREALAIRRKRLGEEHPEVARSLTSLGACLIAQARYAEAEAALMEALVILRQAPDQPHPYEYVTLDKLARLYDAWGRPEQAINVQRQQQHGAPGGRL